VSALRWALAWVVLWLVALLTGGLSPLPPWFVGTYRGVHPW
jgi:hypothetical protein